MDWGNSSSHSDSVTDEGVISDGCVPHTATRSGYFSDSDADVSERLSDSNSGAASGSRRGLAASTPLTGQRHNTARSTFPTSTIEAILGPDGPQMLTRAQAKALANDQLPEREPGAVASTSDRSPSLVRDDDNYCDEMRVDLDGTYFFDDPSINTSHHIDLTLDLEQMRAYYHLGFFTENPESLPPMDLTNSGEGCLPGSSSNCKVS